MTRPRRPPEPGRYSACCRCGDAYPATANWPDGTICQYCYMAAKRTRGRCPCGHDGVLPGRDSDGRPTCRTCSGIQVNVDCRRCGAEDELYRAGSCWRCVLGDEIHAVLAGQDRTIPDRLEPLATALQNMKRSNSGLTWIRLPHVQTLLRKIGTGSLALDHGTFDSLPESRTVEYVRGLLVEHHVLPARDRLLATYDRWLDKKLAAIDDPDQRKIIERFGRWHQLRRLRGHAQDGPVPQNAFLRAKQATTVAIQFLDWLADQEQTLDTLQQRHIDHWYASGSRTRELVETFLYWARSHRLCNREIDIPAHRSEATEVFGEDQRIAAIRHILLDDELALADRIIAGLVLLFGQPVRRIVTLQTDDITITDGTVRLRLARDWLDVPEPFAELLKAQMSGRSNLQTAAHVDSPWVFPGTMPGQHLGPGYVSTILKRMDVPARPTRVTAWRQLVREGPPSVLAEMLGISPATAMRHAELAGADFLRYAPHPRPQPKD